MADAESRKSMTPYDLYNAVDRFITDNTHSSEVDYRWLASDLAGTLLTIGMVRNCNLDEDVRKQVTAFRARELKAEIDGKQREIDRLSRDLEKISA